MEEYLERSLKRTTNKSKAALKTEKYQQELRAYTFKHRRSRSFLDSVKEFDMFGVPIN